MKKYLEDTEDMVKEIIESCTKLSEFSFIELGLISIKNTECSDPIA